MTGVHSKVTRRKFEAWTMKYGQIHLKKTEHKYLKLKIVIKGIFLSFECGKSIKNNLEALQRLLDDEKALQRGNYLAPRGIQSRYMELSIQSRLSLLLEKK